MLRLRQRKWLASLWFWLLKQGFPFDKWEVSACWLNLQYRCLSGNPVTRFHLAFSFWPFLWTLLRLMSELNSLERGKVPSGVPAYPWLRKQSFVFKIHFTPNTKVFLYLLENSYHQNQALTLSEGQCFNYPSRNEKKGGCIRNDAYFFQVCVQLMQRGERKGWAIVCPTVVSCVWLWTGWHSGSCYSSVSWRSLVQFVFQRRDKLALSLFFEMTRIHSAGWGCWRSMFGYSRS